MAYECPMLGNNNNSRPTIIENEKVEASEAEGTSSRNRPAVDVTRAQAMLAQLLSGEDAFNSEIPSSDPLFKAFATKRRKKNNGRVEEVKTLEYEMIYLNEVKEEQDFKLGPLSGEQEVQLRVLLSKYKSIFKEIGRTSVAQHEIYTEEEYLQMEEETYKLLIDYLTDLSDILYKNNKHNPSNPLRVVLRKEVQIVLIVLDAMHESAIGGHLGEKATIQKVCQRYHWPQMVSNIKHFMKVELDVNTYSTEEINGENLSLLIFARVLTLADNLNESRALAIGNIKRSQGKQVIDYNKRYKLHSFAIGDKVWQYKAKLDSRKGGKLEPKWHGPYWVHETFHNGSYKLRTLDGKVVAQSVHENIRTHIQRLAAALESDEVIILDRDCVILRTSGQEFLEQIVLPERKTSAGKIRENLHIYLQDLHRNEPSDLALPFENPGENWDEKLDLLCQK
ncbi:9636_t:CDS:2, partial [Gigaspora margarita]